MTPSEAKFKKRFFSCLLSGDWQTVLSPASYVKLIDWIKRNSSINELVVRFVFWDSEHEARFAVHFVVSAVLTNGSLKLSRAHLPAKESFVKDKRFLLAVPNDLQGKPIFCMPKNLLEGMINNDGI